MRAARTVPVLAGILAASAPTCAGQSVAEAARREKERRAKQPAGTAAMIYTQADLPPRPPGEPLVLMPLPRRQRPSPRKQRLPGMRPLTTRLANAGCSRPGGESVSQMPVA